MLSEDKPRPPGERAGDVPAATRGPAAGSVRAHVYYAGRVQGVGFRYTAVRLARRFVVAGWARNLPDGEVELVAEGERGELARFLAEIERVFAGHIEGTRLAWEPAEGKFARFEIAG